MKNPDPPENFSDLAHAAAQFAGTKTPAAGDADPLALLRASLSFQIWTEDTLARLWKPVDGDSARHHAETADLLRRLARLLPTGPAWPMPFDARTLANAAAFELLENLLYTDHAVLLRQLPDTTYTAAILHDNGIDDPTPFKSLAEAITDHFTEADETPKENPNP